MSMDDVVGDRVGIGQTGRNTIDEDIPVAPVQVISSRAILLRTVLRFPSRRGYDGVCQACAGCEWFTS